MIEISVADMQNKTNSSPPILPKMSELRVVERRISAKAFISYEREAYTCTSDPEFRLTLDENIRARDTDLDLGDDIWGVSLLPEGITLMEVKIAGAMPLWMAKLLSSYEIKKVSYSKYGTYYRDHLMTNQYQERSVIYA